ncbi:MAG: ribosome small subunit-dependent GTPase A [Treponema sp.]|nr:ribosome small subunit-dependent GTPase A [Treponema sp.]
MFDLRDYGFTQADFSAAAAWEGCLPGRVVQDRRNLYTVICERGEVPAILKGSFYYTVQTQEDLPAVGDFVLLKYNAQGNSAVAGVLPRRSKFSRPDFLGHEEGYAKNIKEQILAANFDFLFILCSLNGDFNVNRVSRFLTASWRSGGFPVVLLTKADLIDDWDAPVRAVRKFARDAPVIPVSSKTGIGLDELGSFLEPAKTAVFLGSSGVGKSSLLNRLAGEELMEVKEIRENDSKGRHTTTHRQLCRLPSGALVIDTPGMRELGLWDAGEAVSIAFAEVEEIAAGCRFSDCTHTTEPGCAVLAALAEGRLSPEQWRNYRKQKREAAFVEDSSAYLRQKTEFHKSLARNGNIRNKRKN